VGEHLATIGGRVERLKGIQLEDAIDRDAASFAEEKLAPSWRAVEKEIHGKAANVAGNTGLLDESQRCVSPSDFGFHNALIGTDSRLRFLDFEYAGRDDPAKLVCDFFCQPELPVPIRFWDYFSDRLEAGVGWASGWRERARLLLPAYRVKWCCILLNEFLRSGRDRRAFASSSEQNADRRPTQLDKARKLWGTMGALI
jgi:hypothetical protein